MEVVFLVVRRDHVVTRVVLLLLLLLIVIVLASFGVACVRSSTDLLQGLVARRRDARVGFLECGKRLLLGPLRRSD